MKNKILKKIVASIAAVAMVVGLISVMPAEKAKAGTANLVNVTVSGTYVDEMAVNETLNLHMWGGCRETDWPGVAMKNNNDGTWTASGIVAWSTIDVIVNGNGKQTDDIKKIAVDKKDIYIEIEAKDTYKVSYGTETAEKTDITYTVAGQEGLCGVDWDIKANEMYLNSDGDWIKEFKGIKASTYEFKIVENGSWDNPSYNLEGKGGNNATVTVESYDATVIVTFDGKKAGVIVAEDSSQYTYNVAGSKELCGVEWDPAKNQMTKYDDGTWRMYFDNVAAGDYEYKVVPNGAWGKYAYDNNGITFDANGKINVPKDEAGVVFIFDGSKVRVEIETKQEIASTEVVSGSNETTKKEETTKIESTTEEETTKKAEPSTKEEVTTEEETTKKAEPTTKEEVTTEEETTVKEEPTTEKTTEEETENVIKPSEITKEEGKNSAPETVKKEEIVEPEKVVDTAVEKMEKTDDKTVEVVSPKPQTLTKEIFDTIKSEGKNLTVGVTDADNKLQYSWTFSDKAINNTNMNIDLTITFDAPKKDEISKLTGNKEAAYISFAHHGELPGPATIKTYVGDKYKNGDTVYLYYFDEEANKVLMVGDKPLTVKGGYVEYTITHCSTYFLMGEKLAGVAKDVASLDDANVNVKDSETESTTTSSNPGNTAKPGDNSNVVMWCALLCVMVGIVVFSRKKQLIEE